MIMTSHAAPARTATASRAGCGFLFECRPLLIFTASITLFHFANAAMLPLLGEKLAQTNKGTETLFMAACIITAQIVMVPMAILVGHKADRWGRKPIFLAGFAVLPIRGVLYTLTQNPYALVSIQVLDGIGAGIFGALFFIVIADLTRGTGRYNLAQGTASASWGLGAALSNSIAGIIVDKAGFSAAFLFWPAVRSPPSCCCGLRCRRPVTRKRRPWRCGTTRRRRRRPAESMARFFSLLPEAAAIAIFVLTYLVVAIGPITGVEVPGAPTLPPRSRVEAIEFLEFAMDQPSAAAFENILQGLGFARAGVRQSKAVARWSSRRHQHHRQPRRWRASPIPSTSLTDRRSALWRCASMTLRRRPSAR